MKKMSGWVVACTLLLLSTALSGQDNTLRKEIEVKEVRSGFTVVPVGRNGLLVFYNMAKKGQGTWKFMHMDTTFVTLKEQEYAIGSALKPIDFGYREDEKKIYILFAKNKSSKVITYDLPTGEISQIAVQGKGKSRNLTDFRIRNGIALYGGHTLCSQVSEIPLKVLYPFWWTGSQLGIIRYKPHACYSVVDVAKGNSRTEKIQGGGNSFVSGISDAPGDEEGMVMSVATRKSHKTLLAHYFIYDSGQPEKFCESVLDDDYTLMNTRVFGKGKKDFFIAGNYCRGGGMTEQVTTRSVRENLSDGLFFGRLVDGKTEFIKFYPLSDLNEFKSQIIASHAKWKSRSDRKAIERIQTRGIKKNLLIHEDVLSLNGYYVVVSEVYWPLYTTECSNSYVDGRFVEHCKTVFAGYIYSYCIAVAFDDQGNIVWDYSYPLDMISSYVLHPKFLTYVEGRDIRFMYTNMFGRQCSFLIRDGKKEGGVTFTGATSRMTGIENNSTGNNVMLWYDGKFVAYGSSKKPDQKGSSKKSKNSDRYFFVQEI
ncbi:MAG: hypothetical protein KKA07_11290 [Bacteroidetes bacterium]|nr:hypothetical protein [Bacteroidota bacterium]MBU1719643.1 hypothetical protein [Bacteroidota bacterium]